MKVCVSLRDPADNDLRDGNFRSEPRWERLALEACISNPEITEIYTLGYRWTRGASITPKYKGAISKASAPECVLIIQDCNTSMINLYRFKAVIINIFHGPWIEQKNEVWAMTARLNNNVFFTMGHPTLYADEVDYPEIFGEDLNFPIDEGTISKYRNFKSLPLHIKDLYARVRKGLPSHIRNFTTMDRFFFLPAPWVPESYYKDRFDNKGLLWSCRLICMYQLLRHASIKWALEELLKDDSLFFNILTGFNVEEARIIDESGTAIYLKEDINDYFWNFEEFKPYLSVRDRVKVHYGLTWREVLEINAVSKLLVFYGRQYGGPPVEAAMYGVPFIGSTDKAGALVGCSDYLHTESEGEACEIFSRLMTDHEYYIKIATSYNKYAVDTYSFDTFNKTLNSILRDKGVI